MHWILLIICCASVYGGMVAKSPVAMAVFFLVAVVSCAAWLRVRYTLLFPGGTAATAGAGGLSDVDLDSLRAHVRAHAQSKAGTAPEKRLIGPRRHGMRGQSQWKCSRPSAVSVRPMAMP